MDDNIYNTYNSCINNKYWVVIIVTRGKSGPFTEKLCSSANVCSCFLSPVHMRWFTHGVQIIHICIICTRVYFWACERNCIYVKVNLHMCKYTPPCKYTPAQTRCIFAFAYMYFLHVCIFGHVNAQQIYTPMQM